MQQQNEITIIRFPALSKKLGGVSRSTIARWEKSRNFPKSIQLGKNSKGWNLQAVDIWLGESHD